MAYEYKLTLTVTNTGETISVAGQFTKEDWERLEDFLEYTNDLLDTKLVRDEGSASLSLSWNAESNRMQFSTTLPPWDDVTVFLHKFRPIGLETESTSFKKISSLLGEHLDHPYFRGMIKRQHDIYYGKKLRSAFQIRANDVVLNSEKVLYDWLNAYEYHRNKEKRKFIDSLHTMFPLDASKVLFINLLMEKVEAIYNTAGLISVILGKQTSIEGPMDQLK